MIEEIQGTVLHKTPTFCVVDCHGIGIGVFISINTFKYLGNEGHSVRMLTHLHVREDALQLYGFSEESERTMFRQLIAVGGIGPRLAITILSGLNVSELMQAIASDNHESLTRIPGVGKKTAQRLVLELKDKIEPLPEWQEAAEKPTLTTELQSTSKEAVLALVSLGYREAEARKSVHNILQRDSGELPVEEIIKLALKEI